MNKIFRLILLTTFCFLTFVAIFGQKTTIDERSLKGRADQTSDAPIVARLLSGNEIILAEEKVTPEQFVKKLDALMDATTIDNRTLHIAGEANIPYERAIQLMKLGRQIQIDDYNLQVLTNNKYTDFSESLDVKIPLASFDKNIKPSPTMLLVTLSKDGKITMNSDPETSKTLTVKLKQIFKQRRQKRIFIQGSQEVEKTVFIKANLSAKLGDVVKVIETVKKAGAFPIGLQIDDLPQ
jgi:biopolymer transport protein ExbD